MERPLYCDRIEEGIAVLLDGDTVYEVSADLLPHGLRSEGRHYRCTFRDGVIIAAESAEDPHPGENKKRLTALFRKSRQNRQK